MRRMTAVLLTGALTSMLLVMPTVTAPAAAARPVAPTIQIVPLRSLDTSVLAASPMPFEAGDARAAGATATPWRPVAATRAATSKPFSAVGVTWAADPAVDVAVQVRTRSGGRWRDWTEVEVQANSTGDAGSAEATAARSGSDALFVGSSDAVQVRVDSGTERPRDLRLDLIDPGKSPADRYAMTDQTGTTGGATAHAAEAQPALVTRAGWGADESLRRCTPTVSSTIKGGILHTTATGNQYTADQSAAIMRSMYAYHTQSLGWCDLGYNFVVDKFGTVFEGRYGGVEKAVIGAHTGGFNTHTFGVSMIGNHDLVAPTPEMWTSVARVFAWKLGRYGIDPTATTTYTSAGGSSTKYPYGTEITMPVISGHRDYSTKSCPGNYAYPLLPELREDVAQRMGATSSGPAATAMSLSTNPSRISYGTMTTITGTLAATDGTPLAGKTVRLYVRRRGTTTWAQLSTRTTAADGVFEGTHAAVANLDYRARFEQDAQHAGAVADGRVNVAPAVSATLSSPAVRRGGSAIMRGSVTPTHAGQLIVRQRLVRGSWANVATTPISTDGTYTFTMKPKSEGVKYFRVVKPADTDHVKGLSAVRTLTVD